jgi:T3SS negative regulator,GrlR
MVDGFWTIQYEAEGYRGAGVVMLLNGKLYGGDSGFTYLGSYSETGDSVTAEIKVRNFESEVRGLMGLSDYTLSLQGRSFGDVITGNATTPSSPGVTMDIRMTKRSALQGDAAHAG